MPPNIRTVLRAPAHPARTVPCPHCKVGADRPCTTKAGRRISHVSQPDHQLHDGRITAWVTATSVCPACQVTPGTPCHLDGWPLKDGAVHGERAAIAEVTAAWTPSSA
jgi:hypothetical protein